jgi:arginine decarboxylase
VKLNEMSRRITGVMLVPYPPGIPVHMPGERLGDANSPVIRLLMALEAFGKRFPGFEREVHGIEVDSQGNYWLRAVIEASNEIHHPASEIPMHVADAIVKKRRRLRGPKPRPRRI